jgi:hypothetical protein
MTATATDLPHAGAVRARARIARRALFLARLGESVHIGGAAAMFALVLVVLEGGRTDRLSSALVALVCGLLTSFTWALAHRRTALEVAQRLDRRMELGGAFLTAWEHDGEHRGGTLAELLVVRAAREVPGRAATRAVLPHSWPILASPFVVGAFLAALSSGVDEAELLQREQHQRVAAELGALAGAQAEGGLSFEEERVLRSLARSAEALVADSRATADAEDSAALAEELRSLRVDLPAGSEVGRKLDELAGRLEAGADEGGTGGAGEATGDAASDGSQGTGGPPLARAGADGTIAARETRPGPGASGALRPESAWIDPAALPPDLLRILDDWDATPPGDAGR